MLFVAPREVAVRSAPLPVPVPGEALVATIVSAISAGTELLVYRDEVPADMALDANIASLAGSFGYPLSYGYCAVGRVVAVGAQVDGPWLDRLVFALHPHESHFTAPTHELEPVPDGTSPDDAALFAAMETAVTLVLDGRPLVGERVAVLGQGTVGLLTTALLASFPLAELVTVDAHPLRRELSRELGADRALDPVAARAAPDGDVDLCYELTGDPTALDDAIARTGFHGRVVIGSWYGSRRAPVSLGGAFHRSRIRISSSQVSTIDPALTGRWSRERRRAQAWRSLAQIGPARLITHRFALADAAAAYELLDQRPHEAVQVLLTYD
ncbi:MAG: hypothetical protein QOJ46_792 [bacterium]